MYVLDAQKNRLIETVLLSTHNICFGLEIRKLFFKIRSVNYRPDLFLSSCIDFFNQVAGPASMSH